MIRKAEYIVWCLASLGPELSWISFVSNRRYSIDFHQLWISPIIYRTTFRHKDLYILSIWINWKLKVCGNGWVSPTSLHIRTLPSFTSRTVLNIPKLHGKSGWWSMSLCWFHMVSGHLANIFHYCDTSWVSTFPVLQLAAISPIATSSLQGSHACMKSIVSRGGLRSSAQKSWVRPKMSWGWLKNHEI